MIFFFSTEEIYKSQFSERKVYWINNKDIKD